MARFLDDLHSSFPIQWAETKADRSVRDQYLNGDRLIIEETISTPIAHAVKMVRVANDLHSYALRTSELRRLFLPGTTGRALPRQSTLPAYRVVKRLAATESFSKCVGPGIRWTYAETLRQRVPETRVWLGTCRCRPWSPWKDGWAAPCCPWTVSDRRQQDHLVQCCSCFLSDDVPEGTVLLLFTWTGSTAIF